MSIIYPFRVSLPLLVFSRFEKFLAGRCTFVERKHLKGLIPDVLQLERQIHEFLYFSLIDRKSVV